MPDKIPVLILAAGSSSRMEGDIKQLLPFKKTTLLGHAITQAKAVSEETFVVLGAHFEAIYEAISKDTTVIFNPNWESGIGTSIAEGIKQILEKDQEIKAVLIMLADQPLVDANFLQEMIHMFNTNSSKIIATQYGRKLGVPAIFDFSLLVELKDLREDYGARHIIQTHSEEVLGIDPKGKEFDVDNKKNYLELLNASKTNN